MLARKVLLLLMASLLFAGSFVAGKYTTVDLEPITTSLLRYLVALLFLSALVVWYRPESLRLAAADLLPMALLGTFGIVGYHYFFFASLRHTEVANTAIINAVNPVLTGLLAAVFIQERLHWRSYVGVAIAFVGVLILITQGQLTALFQLDFNRGDLLMMAAVMSWVVYSLLIRQLSKRYSGYAITFYAALFGVLQLAVLAIPEGAIAQVQAISLASIFAVLYMGIGASGIGYFLYNLSVKDVGPTRTSSFVYSFVPIFVALLAFLFFGETVTPIMLVSMTLIIVGLNFTLKGTSKRPVPPDPFRKVD